jgi:hypothetical protein
MSLDPLDKLREICRSLPEAEVSAENGMGRPQLRVRGKVFGWYMDDHHGDGRLALWCKAPTGLQGALVGGNPVRFFVPPYVGPKGWIGIRFDVEGVDWDEVSDLVEQSYRMTAPKRLSSLLDKS